jgi:hypothetical protein
MAAPEGVLPVLDECAPVSRQSGYASTMRSRADGPVLDQVRSRWRGAAAAVLRLQALVVAGFAAGAGARLVSGEAVVPRNEAMLAVTLVGFALALAVVGRGLARGSAGACGASVTWHLLLLLALGGGLWQSGHQLASVAACATAVIGGGLAVLATRPSGGPA